MWCVLRVSTFLFYFDLAFASSTHSNHHGALTPTQSRDGTHSAECIHMLSRRLAPANTCYHLPCIDQARLLQQHRHLLFLLPTPPSNAAKQAPPRSSLLTLQSPKHCRVARLSFAGTGPRLGRRMWGQCHSWMWLVVLLLSRQRVRPFEPCYSCPTNTQHCTTCAHFFWASPRSQQGGFLCAQYVWQGRCLVPRARIP